MHGDVAAGVAGPLPVVAFFGAVSMKEAAQTLLVRPTELTHPYLARQMSGVKTRTPRVSTPPVLFADGVLRILLEKPGRGACELRLPLVHDGVYPGSGRAARVTPYSCFSGIYVCSSCCLQAMNSLWASCFNLEPGPFPGSGGECSFSVSLGSEESKGLTFALWPAPSSYTARRGYMQIDTHARGMHRAVPLARLTALPGGPA